MVLVSSVNCPFTVFFSLMVTTKLSRFRISLSEKKSKTGGQTIAVGPAVGMEAAVGVGIAVASTEAITVGSADAVGSRLMSSVGAGLQAWSSKAHTRTRTDVLANMVGNYILPSPHL